jgi:hypothetical protein
VRAKTVTGDRDTREDNLPKWHDLGFWTARGYVMIGGAFLSVLGTSAGVY